MVGPMGRFYVTTPIYYVNDLPHIGHIYTTTVADVIARWRRLEGDEVRFLTGTDEHGQNIERAARREGITPRQLADRVVERYHALWRTFGMSHDDFIRTTDERHVQAVEAMVARLRANGDLYEAHHEGWYCSPCESFYTDKEIGEAKRCPTHELPVEWKSEENVFFRLSRYQDRLLAWYAQEPCPVRPDTRRNEVRTFVESGLRDLSVSRSTPWGIPFPGQPGQTVYVWLDALTNYVAALGFGGADAALYDRFWADQAATRLHLVGKDIVRFHAVYWPAFLMAAGLPLPSTVWAHGFWLRDDRKISKSAGNVVRPNELIERFGADPLRYFLLREMSFGADASFSDEGFIGRYNSDLANDLGNTVSRLVTLSRSAFDGRTPPLACDDNPLLVAAAEAIPVYRQAMDDFAFHRALEALWHLLSVTGQYLGEREPWKLIKSEPGSDRLSRVLWNGLEATRLVATALLPFMPELAPRILAAIGAGAAPSSWRAENGRDVLSWGGLPTGVPLAEPAPLFPRIDKKAYLAEVVVAAPAVASATPPPANPAAKDTPAPMSSDAPTSTPPVVPTAGASAAATAAATTTLPELRPTIGIEQFAAVDLRVATVQAAERVAKSNKLLRLTVDAGEGAARTVVAGIGKKYAPEELVGRQVIIVANLAPATLMGVESNGMVLAADGGEGPVVLAPSAPVANGTRVR